MTPGVPGHVGGDVAECQCGDRFQVIYKAPLRRRGGRRSGAGGGRR